MCRRREKKGKYVSAIRSRKQFKFRMASLAVLPSSLSLSFSLSLFPSFLCSSSLERPIRSLRPFLNLLYSPPSGGGYTDATKRRASSNAILRESQKSRGVSFSWNRMPILYAASGIVSNCWKVFHRSDGEEKSRREFTLIPFNLVQHPTFLRSSAILGTAQRDEYSTLSILIVLLTAG